MLLNCGVGEDSWESLGLQRSNQSILKEISSEYSLEGLMLKLKFQYFGHLMQRADSFEKTWCWEGLGAGGEGDERGWDGWMASLTRWTWVWVNSGSWWWTGRPGVLRFMGSQSWTRLSDWPELNCCTSNFRLTGLTNFVMKLTSSWAPLVTQWYRLFLPMQETQVQSLSWEDPRST